MPKFTVPKVVRPIELADYATEYGDAEIQVWINPPADVRKMRFDLLKDYADLQDKLESKQDITEQATFAEWKKAWFFWFAEIWSQNTNSELNWTVAEILEMERLDPALISWLFRRTQEIIDNPKKALPTA